jgi:hypothetical protein
VLGLVVATGVQGELAQQLAVLGDDPHLQISDQDQDAGAGVAAAQADVVEPTVVAQGDDAGAVDLVVADAVVGRDPPLGACGSGLRARGKGGCWGAAAQGPMGPSGVVVVAEPIQLGLQLRDGVGLGLLGEPALEGLVEALDLAAGLGMVGAGVPGGDPRASSSSSMAQRPPPRRAAVNTAPLSVSSDAG